MASSTSGVTSPSSTPSRIGVPGAGPCPAFSPPCWAERARALEIGALAEPDVHRRRLVPMHQPEPDQLARPVQTDEADERTGRLDGPALERDDDVVHPYARPSCAEEPGTKPFTTAP